MPLIGFPAIRYYNSYNYIYKDESNFYIHITYLNVRDEGGTCFKIAVRNRFLYMTNKNLCLHLFGDRSVQSLILAFIAFFMNIQASTLFTFKRRLKFHGMSFGTEYDAVNRALMLNIGYTHAPVIMLPSYITSIRQNRKNKRKLLLESHLSELVANLSIMIKNLRPVRLYFNPAKRGGRRGIRVYMTRVRRKKFKKDARFR